MNMMSTAASLLPDKAFVRLIAQVHRRFEPELTRVYKSYPGGGSFVDVGAWYGPWTYWMSRKADHVTAFEPNPEVGDVLVGAVRPNVTVLRAAASSSEGTATLSLPAGGRGTEGRASLGSLSDGDRQIEVPTVRIDDLGLTDVSLLKIDVEGHEMPALQGATDLLATQHPVLVIELEERHGGILPAVRFLAERGYGGQVMVRDHWISLDDFDLVAHQLDLDQRKNTAGYLTMAIRPGERYINNVVFTHESSRWRVR